VSDAIDAKLASVDELSFMGISLEFFLGEVYIEAQRRYMAVRLPIELVIRSPTFRAFRVG
jgi:hypothetical protein